jgi:exopolysaccharide biosynthesis polyprenyl glycosylphosphotransferase
VSQSATGPSPVTDTPPETAARPGSLEALAGRRRPRRPASRLSAQYLLEGAGWTPLRATMDLVMATLALLAAVAGASSAGVPADGWIPLLALPALVMAGLALRGAYQVRVGHSIIDVVTPVLGAVSVSAMVLISWAVLTGRQDDVAPLVARAWLFGLVFVAAGRVTLVSVQRRARSRRDIGKRTLIVGAGLVGVQVAQRLIDHREYGLQPVGFLDADPAPYVSRTALGVPVLGAPADLAAVAEDMDAQHVILAFSSAPDGALVRVVRLCEALGLEVSLVPRMFESITDRMALDRLGALPLLGLRSVDPRGWQFACKYAADRILAMVLLLAVAPLLLATALAVRLTSPGPVLFRQRRVGRDGKAFDLLKFRSMYVEGEPDTTFEPAPGAAPGGVEGEDRRTPLGRFLRRSSLDELPQLVNVLQGDMSLVGPRPERPEFVELFSTDLTRYGDRHRVKSGITGWAQVHGLRGQTSLSDRVEWDNFYIENWSLWLDCKIVLMTVSAIFTHRD